MNAKVILTSLVLGSSSVAMASPSVTFSANANATYGTTIARDHRVDADGDHGPVVTYPTEPGYGAAPFYHDGRVWRGERMPPVYRPVLLASDMHFGRDGRSFITVGGALGRFGKLQISASGGRTFIKQVYVQFENGQSQVIRDIDRMLIGHQTLILDLDGGRRAIRRIVVYGDTFGSRGWNGWRRAAGTFSVMGA